MRKRGICFVVAGVLAAAACTSAGIGVPAAPGAAGDGAAARAVEAVVADSFFGSIARSDYDGILQALTPTYELNEDTLRLTGPGFVALVRSFEGKAAIRYRLDGFNTRVVGRTAWTSYRNHGTLTPAGSTATHSLEWSETAVLVQDASGRWRINRMHSTPLNGGG